MKLNLRIPLFITLVVASVGIGTVGVHASTDCQHLFVRIRTNSPSTFTTK